MIKNMLEVVGDDFIKKETLTKVFSCPFWKDFKDKFFTKHLQVTASILSHYMPMISFLYPLKTSNDQWLK